MNKHNRSPLAAVTIFVVAVVLVVMPELSKSVFADTTQEANNSSIQFSTALTQPTMGNDQVISVIKNCSGFASDLSYDADYFAVTDSSNPLYTISNRPLWRVGVQGDLLLTQINGDNSTTVNPHIKTMTALFDESGKVLSIYSARPASGGIEKFRGKNLTNEFRSHGFTLKESSRPLTISLMSALNSVDKYDLIANATEINAYHGLFTSDQNLAPFKIVGVK